MSWIFSSWMADLPKWIGNTPVVIAANKADLLPEFAHRNKVEDWLRQQAQQRGMPLEQIFLVSAETGYGMDRFKAYLEREVHSRTVFMVGRANVGKSTMINRLLSLFDTERRVQLTTSRFPGTTLSTVAIRLEGLPFPLVDTPGILTRQRVTDVVCPECLRQITPREPIRPRIYQLNPGQTVWLGGLCRFDFVTGRRQPFVVYVANSLTVHRTKTENADPLYQRHRGELLSPPCSQCPDLLRRLQCRKVELRAGPPVDIVVSGIGWISVRGHACTLSVWTPEGIAPVIRRAII
jgi:ribosome biogenesis GTPase YqeH